MNALRILKHWFIGSIPISQILSAKNLNAICNSISEAEITTSAEIRFIAERALPTSYLLRNAPANERAKMLFSKYRCWDTEDNNGVLLYICPADHAIEILLDRAAARVISQKQLSEIIQSISLSFLAQDFEGGIILAIKRIASLLAPHFPSKNEENPLPNEAVLL